MLDLGPSGSYPHTFLVADDSFAPAFTEIIGDTVTEAMADDNHVYTMQAGEIVSKTFDIKSVSLDDAQQMEITGIHELPYSEKIEWAPWEGSNGNRIAMYHGKVIVQVLQGVENALYEEENSIAEAINIGLEWRQFNSKKSTPISSLRIMGATISNDEKIGANQIDQNAEMQFINIPIFTSSN